MKPIEKEVLDFIRTLSRHSLGNKLVLHTEDRFPDLTDVKIALVGVLENRGATVDVGEVNLIHFRKEFYSLFPGNWGGKIADLGNVVQGNSLKDTYYVLEKIISNLIKSKIIPIVIGGSQDLTYAMYRGYDQLEQMVNLVAIDSKFDFVKEEETKQDSSYLTKMIVDKPNNLFNYSNVGYQTYCNSQEEIDLIEKLFFEAYRLGEVTSSLSIAEPIFRDADLVSLDLSVVRSSDSGNFITFVPNGFNGKEICSLSRYAGISDKVSAFGIFNHKNSKTEAPLISQIVWYFIEGFHYRSNEYPFGSREDYIKYIVSFEDEEIVFFKSNKTDRWWIEIPFIFNTNNKLNRSTLLPCTHEDYLGACNHELPERWWKAQRKNIF